MSHKRITIGIPCYDDYDGTYFTLQNIRLGHLDILDQLEFLIIDNDPGTLASLRLKKLAERIPDVTYIPFGEWVGTAAPRDLIFRLAQTPFVLCVDSHILVQAGAIERVLAYLDGRPDCPDLLQGPLLHDGLQRTFDHMEPRWNRAMWGDWASDPRADSEDGQPYEIGMQGLGLFACTREAWPGFNPRMMGFGGEEGYLHEKFRQAGNKTLCLPFLRWLHRFNRPQDVPHTITARDRIMNYLIGYRELGLDQGAMRSHFRFWYGANTFEALYQDITAELDSPFLFFDAIYWLSTAENQAMTQSLAERLHALGIGRRVRLLRTDDVEDGRQQMLNRAWVYGFETLLIITDEVAFSNNALEDLGSGLAEMAGAEWDVLTLSGSERDSAAIVYKRTAFVDPQQSGLVTKVARPPITL
jgi:hypothetical protein